MNFILRLYDCALSLHRLDIHYHVLKDKIHTDKYAIKGFHLNTINLKANNIKQHLVRFYYHTTTTIPSYVSHLVLIWALQIIPHHIIHSEYKYNNITPVFISLKGGGEADIFEIQNDEQLIKVNNKPTLCLS